MSSLKAIGRAFVFFLGLSLGAALLILVFKWELLLEKPFVELGPTQLLQTLFILASSVLFFREARRQPDMRGALVLVGGFLGCMFIREQDFFFGSFHDGCWVWFALALAVACVGYACLDLRRTVAGLERFVRWKYFPFLVIGLVIVLAYSRLFGMGSLWRGLMGDKFVYEVKSAVEESTELLGYLFIFTAALLSNIDKRLK